ncbi:helix-turn-helix transcriptional regulator [Nocardia wallacei]|uniref:helix-turn-helix transcriptional regulator n=1 Tax=Nocardia wallacei TaxID=480035 RepID=UPI002454A4FC|nr:helix-turn-helix transcriptional regulator [Nocardia wallacei]
MTTVALSDFLRSRRARITPEDVGLVSGGGRRRRVPGLRREELALLAGVSVDYYVRLEQGRNPNVSDSVLVSVATALRLDNDEREHLFRLARPPRPGYAGTQPEIEVRPEVQQMLDWIVAPAIVIGYRLQVLAWNPPAERLIADFGRLTKEQCNLAWLYLVDPGIISWYQNRQLIIRELVAGLRLASGYFPDDSALTDLIDRLRTRNAEFAHEWETYTVHTQSAGTVRMTHPELGPLTLEFERTHFPRDPGNTLIVFTAATATPEAEVLRRLGSHIDADHAAVR